VALGKSKVLLRNGANILKIIICEPFILIFSILELIFHNLSKKCLNWFTDASCHYDMIIGRDMLQAMGLIVDFKDNLMTWDDFHDENVSKEATSTQ
jgi:hypothetical protein